MSVGGKTRTLYYKRNVAYLGSAAVTKWFGANAAKAAGVEKAAARVREKEARAAQKLKEQAERDAAAKAAREEAKAAAKAAKEAERQLKAEERAATKAPYRKREYYYVEVGAKGTSGRFTQGKKGVWWQ